MIFKKEQINIIFIIILASCIYFSVLPYFIKLWGITVRSGYYELTHFSDHTFIALLLHNLIYTFVLLALFYFFLYKNKINIVDLAERKVPSFVIFVIIGASVLLSISYFSLSRTEIKDASNLGVETIFIFALTLISYTTLVTKKRSVLLLNIFLILYFSFILFEREVILYAVVPFLLRSGVNVRKMFKFVAMFIILASLILNYKLIINLLKEGDLSQYSNTESKSILYSLGVDSVHKMSLEASYIEGDVPEYNNATLYVPYQVLRFFEPERTTNARMATTYYTNENTGTGFSFLLEGFLNFSYLAPFILPFILLSIFGVVNRYFGVVAVTPFLVFIVKIQRAELWPLMISTLIIPLLLIAIISYLNRLITFKN